MSHAKSELGTFVRRQLRAASGDPAKTFFKLCRSLNYVSAFTTYMRRLYQTGAFPLEFIYAKDHIRALRCRYCAFLGQDRRSPVEYLYIVGWMLVVVAGTFCFAALQWPALLTTLNDENQMVYRN
jgi:hypothetical protein